MKKETKRDYLRRILEFEPYDFRNDNMSSIEKAYNNFLKAFKFNDIRNSEVEKIFIYFYSHSLTPSNIINKTADKASRYEDLQKLHSKTIEYFNNCMKPIFMDKALKQHPKDAMTYIDEVSFRYNLIECFEGDDYEYYCDDYDYDYDCSENTPHLDFSFPTPYDLKTLIENFEKNYNVMLNYVNCFMAYLFDDSFRKNPRNDEDIDWLEDAVSSIKNEYYKYRTNCEKSYNEIISSGKEIYCNPYKNIYLYCLSAYLQDYYSMDIPNIKIGKFYELKNFDFKIDKKEFYSLSDIAEIYCKMCYLDIDNLEKVKKEYKKYIEN